MTELRLQWLRMAEKWAAELGLLKLQDVAVQPNIFTKWTHQSLTSKKRLVEQLPIQIETRKKIRRQLRGNANFRGNNLEVKPLTGTEEPDAVDAYLGRLRPRQL